MIKPSNNNEAAQNADQVFLARIEDYILDNIDPEDAVLHSLDRETHIRMLKPRMVSGHLQGNLLTMLARLISARTALELGTYTGYSAICIARGLQDGGALHTIEVKEELEPMASEFIEKSGYRNRIVQHIGNALTLMDSFTQQFDLVFIDADKREYDKYYEKLWSNNMIHSGSLIIADNTLWSGKVVENPDPKDRYTSTLLRFNRMVADDTRVEKVILPLRDGLTLIRVK